MFLYIVTLLFILYMCYTWLNKNYNYWNVRGINGPKPLPIVGNFKTIMLGTEHAQDFVKRVYDNFPNDNYIGIYQALTPALIVKDPKMIKQVLINDFNTFHDRNFKIMYPFNDNVVMAEGDTWSVLRSISTSTLTLSKLKNYIPVLEKSAEIFSNHINGVMESGSVHDVQDLFGLFFFNAAGFNLFGIDFNVYSKEKKHLQDFVDEFLLPGLISRIITYLELIVPGILKIASLLKIDKRSNAMKRFVLPFINKVLEDKNRGKTAFMDQIIQLKKQKFIEKQYEDKTIRIECTDNLILSQVIIWLAGHTDGPARITMMVMYELSLHQSEQDRLYSEVNQHYRNNNAKISYESLNKMIYLDMVIKETMRKHVGTGTLRQAVYDYEFPGIGLKIKKGTFVMIPMPALQNDPKYFRDPDVFDPERFSAVNERKITDCTFIPFGLGPRNCPGTRVTDLLVKFSVASFLLKFKVEACDKTEKNLKFVPGFTKSKVTGGVWLKISKRSVSE